MTAATFWTALRMALRMVRDEVACTTSSAVSGASTGRDNVPGSSRASR